MEEPWSVAVKLQKAASIYIYAYTYTTGSNAFVGCHRKTDIGNKQSVKIKPPATNTTTAHHTHTHKHTVVAAATTPCAKPPEVINK